MGAGWETGVGGTWIKCGVWWAVHCVGWFGEQEGEARI